MQHRMKTHPLREEQIKHLLERVQTGSMATRNPDGAPYSTPIHFVYFENAIYVHGLPKGKKLDNIANDSRVSFSVYEMDTLVMAPNGKPCDTNTKYESVIISGNAKLVGDMEEKRNVLKKIVEKYTPQLVNSELPNNMVNGTAVIRIDVIEMTGKYYG